jgi:hypothetical protein
LALRISSILKKESGILNLSFDTCGVGYFNAGKDYTPSLEILNALLVKNKLKNVTFTTVAEIEVTKPAAVYQLTISGLG